VNRIRSSLDELNTRPIATEDSSLLALLMLPRTRYRVTCTRACERIFRGRQARPGLWCPAL